MAGSAHGVADWRVVELEPAFLDRIAEVITPSCLGSRCHGGTATNLDLTEPARALAALRSGVGTDACAGLPLLTPGDPDASLFFGKLDRRSPPCGAAMPPGAGVDRSALDAIEEWIALGAPD